MHDVLLALLALDCVQMLAAVPAFVRSRRSRKAGAPSHARYSLEHGLLLLTGGLLLFVPVVLGLAGVVRQSSALIAAVVLEIVAFPVSRTLLRHSEAAHLSRRPA